MARQGEGYKVIADFEAGDVIRLEGTSFTSFADIVANTSDYGNFCVVTLNDASNIWIIGKTSADLHASDFTIV